MALLERINSMKQQGLSETEIINTLKEEGNSPMDINDALSQSQIKAAIAEGSAPAGYEASGMGGMQPSIMAGEESASMSIPEERTAPVAMPQYSAPLPVTTPTQQIAAAQAYEQNQYPAESAYPSEAAYAQGYPQEYGYAPEAAAGYYPQVLDIETVRDISKQQVEEALGKMRGDLLSLAKMKTEMKFEMQDMENRLAKVESMMGEIQASIIRKIGEYGESISSISKEIKATQQSFSKVINPLMDRTRGVSKPRVSEEQEAEEEPEKEEQIAPKKQPAKKPEKKAPRSSAESSSGATFEDYFR
jgi:hypothetical protein